MRKPTFEELRDSYKKMGYAFFTRGTYNHNFFGIRSKKSKSNEFDDWIGDAFYDGNRRPRLYVFEGTTDPGKHWLLNPMNRNGTAIIATGQHRDVFKLGIHGRNRKFPYEALEQVLPIPFVRDNNRDDELDFELYRDPVLRKKHLITDKIIKTNLHRASKWKLLRWIERYSAGCQVVKSPKDFNTLIKLVKRAIYTYGWKNSFSYTLFEEDEIQWR